MTTVKGLFFLLIAAVSPLLIVASRALADTRAPSIGLFVPLTGPLADWGNAIRLGAEMAIAEEQSAAQFLVEDTQFQGAVALSAYDKMLATGRPDALIVFGSGVSMAITPRAERDKLLTISISTSDEVQHGKRYVFRHMVASDVVTSTLIPEVQRRNLKRIASISTTQDGMLSFQRSFLEKAGKSVVFSADVPPGEREFSSLLARVIAIDADSIYSTLLPPQTSILAKQARQLGFKGQFFAATQVSATSELNAGGKAFENLFFVADGDSSRFVFEERFLQRYEIRADSFAANAYDATKLIIFALSKPDPIAALESVRKFRGALGTYDALPDHTFAIPALLNSVSNGQVRLLKNY